MIFSVKYPDIHVISLCNSCESDQQIQRQDKQCLNILSVPPLGGTLYVQDQLNSQRQIFEKSGAVVLVLIKEQRILLCTCEH